MSASMLAAMALSAIGVGGVAYVFLYPILSGANRVEKRQKALVGGPERRERGVVTVNRRDQVAQSLRDLELREKARTKINIETRIGQAGLDWSRRKFFVVSAGLGAALGIVLLTISGSPPTALAGIMIGGLGLPRWVLGFLKKRRINKYLHELPNAIDVIVRGIRSGLPLGDCLRIVASEGQEPVRSEFQRMIEQQALGITISDAVGSLYERLPVAESNFFAIVIGIQAKAGGNLSETLANLSRVLRDRKKMKGKIQAMSMEAKSSAAIIGCLPFVVGTLTYISSPSYIELLWLTNVGKLLLIASALWMTLGCLVMKKMINFDF